jgi:16S rRNA (guanine527-N7)-methyltransferase
MMFKEDLKKILNLDISDEQEKQFDVYYHYLIEYNKITNLTRITEKDEVYYKHFFDSLTIVMSIDLTQIHSLCDMGSGAGFPSIPIKILYPHIKVTIIDALNKRILFLNQLMDKLNLHDVILVHDRIENYAKIHQESFDLVTARALGSMSLISEMGIPMVKKDMYFLGLKAQNYEQELKEAERGIHLLGGLIQEIKHLNLPYGLGERTHIIIKKEKHIKGYPRSNALMSKKPL